MSKCKVIAITNQKGGVGKTTTTLNLGVGLARRGKKVLLIDTDAQANLTIALGNSHPDYLPFTLATVIKDVINDKPIDTSKIIHHDEGVDLIPANIELSVMDIGISTAINRNRILQTFINEIKKDYDYVLIDCMPSLGMLTINALAAADSVIIPTQPHYFSAKGLEQLLRTISKVQEEINPTLKIDGILITMVMARTNISKEVIETIKNAYGNRVRIFGTQIPHSIKTVEAAASCKSIFAYDKRGKVADAYEWLSREVAMLDKKQRKQNRADLLR